jgi:hypothetical protein
MSPAPSQPSPVLWSCTRTGGRITERCQRSTACWGIGIRPAPTNAAPTPSSSPHLRPDAAGGPNTSLPAPSTPLPGAGKQPNGSSAALLSSFPTSRCRTTTWVCSTSSLAAPSGRGQPMGGPWRWRLISCPLRGSWMSCRFSQAGRPPPPAYDAFRVRGRSVLGKRVRLSGRASYAEGGPPPRNPGP